MDTKTMAEKIEWISAEFADGIIDREEYIKRITSQLDEAVSSAQMEWEGVRLPVALGLAFEQGFAAAREHLVGLVKSNPTADRAVLIDWMMAMTPSSSIEVDK